MKHSTTIVFLSSTRWEHPNKQLQYLAQEFSQHQNVLFIDTIEPSLVSFFNLFSSPSKRKQYQRFGRQIWFQDQSLITHPIFITLYNYESGQELTIFDQFLFVFQILFFIIIGSRSLRFAVWCCSQYMGGQFALFSKVPGLWIYDFFDRIFDYHDPKQNMFFRQCEGWILRRAQIVGINSTFYHALVRKLVPQKRQSIVRFPVGYQLKPFLSASIQQSSTPVIGYVGNINHRLDMVGILAIVEYFPKWKFVFSGPIEADAFWLSPEEKMSVVDFVNRLKSFSNVTILKSTNRISEQIKILESFSVGWIPYDLAVGFNRYCNPTKYYEYMAVGLPVVSTEIPALKEHREHIRFFSHPREFGEQVRELLKEKNNTLQSVDKRRQYIQEQDISRKISMAENIFKEWNL